MSKRTREVWRCDVCGWEWLPDTNKVPERCPNRKCRKRNWNHITGQPNEASYAGLPIQPVAFGQPLTQQRLPRSLITGAVSKAQYVGQNFIQHSETCKCLMCKPPKP